MGHPEQDRGGRHEASGAVRTPHLKAALAALGALVALGVAGVVYARALERRYVHALAFRPIHQKIQGSALQQEAFRQPDLLPVYGSSELLNFKDYTIPFEPRSLFRSAPTGFRPFLLGRPQNACLHMLQKLAAVGDGLRGRKVVISISPSWFFSKDVTEPQIYAGNFSPLHASELTFSSQLSFELKSEAARRMLAYPGTLERRPVLRFALECLAEGSSASRALYWLALPLGKLETLVLRLQDHARMAAILESTRRPRAQRPRASAEIDWPALEQTGEHDYARRTGNNPYGFDSHKWHAIVRQFGPRNTRLPHYQEFVRSSKEWIDLELLLRGLKELGARPLILSMPIHGPFFDTHGLPAADRAVYYERVRALAAKYGMPALVFDDHDGDLLFAIDPFGHPSPKGLVYLDKVLDDFYHGALPTPAQPDGAAGDLLPGHPAGAGGGLRQG